MNAFVEFFKFIVPSLSDKLNGNLGEWYNAYYAESDICSSIFWYGLIIACVAAVVFYYVICNSKGWVSSLAKTWFWFVMLAVVGSGTFFLSQELILGNDGGDSEQSSGVYKSAYKLETEKIAELSHNDPNADNSVFDQITDARDEYLSQYREGEETLPMEMGIANGLAAMIIFIIFSGVITHVRFLSQYTSSGSGIPL